MLPTVPGSSGSDTDDPIPTPSATTTTTTRTSGSSLSKAGDGKFEVETAADAVSGVVDSMLDASPSPVMHLDCEEKDSAVEIESAIVADDDTITSSPVLHHSSSVDFIYSLGLPSHLFLIL